MIGISLRVILLSVSASNVGMLRDLGPVKMKDSEDSRVSCMLEERELGLQIVIGRRKGSFNLAVEGGEMKTEVSLSKIGGSKEGRGIDVLKYFEDSRDERAPARLHLIS